MLLYAMAPTGCGIFVAHLRSVPFYTRLIALMSQPCSFWSYEQHAVSSRRHR